MDGGILAGLALVLGGSAAGVANLKWRAWRARRSDPPPLAQAVQTFDTSPEVPASRAGFADHRLAESPVTGDAIARLANPGHLNEIGVAFDGSLIAVGSIDHPVDENGHFPCPEAELVRISREGGLRIMRCRAFRTPSGFLRAEEYGSELLVPAPLAAIVERALRIGAKEALRASLTHQDGQLRDSTSRMSTLSQPLSAWSLEVDEAGGAVHVVLSARLHGEVIPEWLTSMANYWPAEQDSRLVVRFRVDPITRVACFGAYAPALTKEPETLAAIPTARGLAALDLGNAPVGPFAQFAIGDTRWYYIFEGDTQRYLSITEHAPPMRTPLGLLRDTCGYRWPRLELRGIDMRAIASMLGSHNLRSSVTSDTIGEAFESYGSDGFDTYSITSLALDFSLNETGLRLRIEGHTKRGPISRDMLLMWELLILRFPYFTRFRTMAGLQSGS